MAPHLMCHGCGATVVLLAACVVFLVTIPSILGECLVHNAHIARVGEVNHACRNAACFHTIVTY